MGFFTTFSKYNKQLNFAEIEGYKSTDYISYPRTFESITELESVFEKLISKPQELIEDHVDYYVARDIFTNTVYICYRDLLMLDIDIYKAPYTDILELLGGTEYLFDVYKTRNGYHAFCVSNTFEYNTRATVEFMNNMGSDFFYNFYSYLRGCCVRLNRKMREYFEMMSYEDRSQAPMIYHYIGTFGRGIPNERLVQLVKLHYEYVKRYNMNTPVGH